jgi:hypothetical protein
MLLSRHFRSWPTWDIDSLQIAELRNSASHLVAEIGRQIVKIAEFDPQRTLSK